MVLKQGSSMHPYAVSVIISFYNKPEFLEKVLAGYALQQFTNFEVLIADDGSDPEVVKRVRELTDTCHFPIRHIYHENVGWRKNRILNRAAVESKSDYLIFTDGDCIPHHAFVKEHVYGSAPGTILAGRRVYLGPALSKFLTATRISRKLLRRFGLLMLIIDRIVGGSKHIENGIYFKNKDIRKRINYKDKGILGSNFSLHKETLLSVNGFDERYESPAVGEDTDLEYRLRNAGYQVKPVKHLAIQYHLYHVPLKRDPGNLALLEEVSRKKLTTTKFGIRKMT